MAKKKPAATVETPPILHAVPDVPLAPAPLEVITPPRIACPYCGCGHAPKIESNAHHGKRFTLHGCRNCGRAFRIITPDNS